MNWSEYKELSEKTLSTQFHCDEKRIELLLHAVMGILTETEELLDNHLIKIDETNILEEIGDVTWYLAIIGREYNMDFPTDLPLSNEDPMKIVISIIKQTCKLLDMLKKKLYYNKPINDESFKQISTLVMILTQSYMNYYSIDIKGSFNINIAKLKARYGDKFSSDKAINRDLETERKILEGKSVEIVEEEGGIFPSETNVYLDGMGINQRTSTTSIYLD
jgi:NTP pyrophosphatase (non-canonical NTP hydrolase)